MAGLFFVMAIDYTTETRSNEAKVVVLADANSDTSIYLSDQNHTRFGSNRRSEVLGVADHLGQTYEKRYNDYIDSL